MNIAFVVYSHYSRDARVRRYAEALAVKGLKIDVICLKEDFCPKEKNIRLIMYPLERYRHGRLWYFFEYVLFFLFSAYQLTLNYLFKRYRFIHINNMPDFLVFTSFIPKLMCSRIILDMHDPMPELYRSKFKTGENTHIVKLLKLMEKLSMAFADRVLTANENFKTIFLRRNSCPENKISVILNCPDPLIFKSTTPDTKYLIRNTKYFNLLYMGTVDKRFGLDIVLMAMPMLIKHIPNIRFTIIPKIEGEGEYFNNLKFEIRNLKLDKYIRILHPQPLEEVVKQVRRADIGIVLAQDGIFTENIMPVKLLEFVQMGVPVIATRTKALKASFDNHQICFLTKNTPEELANEVIRLHKSRRLRSVFSSRSRKYLEKYNWMNEKKKYMGIISTLTT